MAVNVSNDELHRIVATCIVYRKYHHRLQYLIKRRAAEPPFSERWEAGAGGGATRKELDAFPGTADGQTDVAERLARLEVRQELGIAIGELHYLGTFRFIRHDKVPVFGVRFAAEAGRGEIVLEKGVLEYRWAPASGIEMYHLVGEARNDIHKIENRFG